MRSPSVLAPLAFLASAPLLAQGTVHVVDDDGGAGVFADLPAAVAAAADGDVLLVKAGSYSGFTLTAKGLAVVSDSGVAPVVNGGIVVESLGASQSVLLRGLATGTPSEFGLSVQDCDGAVRVEACSLEGQTGFNVFGSFDGHPGGFAGAVVAGSANVAFTDCTLQGGEGADVYDIEWDAMGVGGPGLTAGSSNVAVFDTTATGGFGGSDSSGFALSGTLGGVGGSLTSGRMVVSGSEFVGGQGGYGGSAWEWKGCGSGGDGGNGFTASGGELDHVDTSFVGGPKGYGVTAYGCGHGQIGLPKFISGAVESALPGSARDLSVPAPLRSGIVNQIVLVGEPGDSALVGIALAPDFVYTPALTGALLIEAPTAVAGAFAMPPSGALLVPITYSGLGTSADALPLFAQALFVDSAGTLRLAPASTTVALAPRF